MKERLLPVLALALQLLLGLLLPAAACRAQDAAPALSAETVGQVRALAQRFAAGPAGTRVEIEAGQLDSRLRLAPCQRVEPYLPTGQRLWGKTRVGLRCTSGQVAWNVFLPITVRVWGQATVAAGPLPAGSELAAQDLRMAEVDLAETPSPTFADPSLLIGRRLATALTPLTAVRADHLRAKQWFAAGDPVTVIAHGEGFAISGDGQALSPGIEGQPVRVRTEAGRVVVGAPVGERRVEVRL